MASSFTYSLEKKSSMVDAFFVWLLLSCYEMTVGGVLTLLQCGFGVAIMHLFQFVFVVVFVSVHSFVLFSLVLINRMVNNTILS